jgi:trigger factor
MDVRIEEVGPCKRTLHFQIPAEHVRSKLDQSYLELGQQVEVRGFRKGHVPRKIMEKRFGVEVNKDVHYAIVGESLEKALGEHDLKMIGVPQLPEAPEQLDVEAPLNFDVTVEVQPKIDIPDCTQFELTRRSQAVTGPDVDTAIDRLRRRSATFVPVADDTPQDDDLIVADVVVSVDGSEIDRLEDANVRVGPRAIVGLPCDELPGALYGARTGDTRTVSLTLPEGYRIPEHAGKQAQVAVTVKDLKRMELPAVDEAWARSMRFDSLDDLRATVEASLRNEARASAEANLERQLCDRLLEAVSFDLPEGPVQRLTESNQRRHRLALQMRQVPEDRIEEELAGRRDTAKGEAERECKLFFILHAIADERRLFATEDEVRQRVAQIAANYGRSFENVRSELERDGSMDDLRLMMRREKTIEYLLGRAKIADESASEPAPPAGEAPHEAPSDL